MANSKKLDIVWIALLAVAVVGLILAIVGVCIDYASVSGSAGSFTSESSNMTFGEILDSSDSLEGVGAMAAFAIITIIFAGLTAICVAVCKFVNIKFANIIKLALGALTVIFAIVAIITAFTFCSANEASIASLASINLAPAAGAWLVLVGGVLAGAAGVVAGLKK